MATSTATSALIALGSNLGDRRTNLEGAITALTATPGVTVSAVSSFHETKPVGPEGQPAFLNAAALLETTLDAEPLLDLLNAIEAQARRVRTVRWGARTLDLDLLLFGPSTILHTPRLTLPHPRMSLRRFVLAPAQEIAPNLVDPITHQSINQLLKNIDRRPSHVALHGPPGPFLTSVFTRLVSLLDTAGISSSSPSSADLPVSPCGPSPANDRWLVTDFAPPFVLKPSTSLRTFPPPAPPTQRPTFVVILRPGLDDDSLMGDLDIPQMIVTSTDPETAAAEILAACASTRS